MQNNSLGRNWRVRGGIVAFLQGYTQNEGTLAFILFLLLALFGAGETTLKQAPPAHTLTMIDPYDFTFAPAQASGFAGHLPLWPLPFLILNFCPPAAQAGTVA